MVSSVDHVLTADTAFMTLTLISVLYFPMSLLPVATKTIGQVTQYKSQNTNKNGLTYVLTHALTHARMHICMYEHNVKYLLI